MSRKSKIAWVGKAEVSSVKTHSSRPSNAGPGSPADLVLLEYGKLFGRGVVKMLAAVAGGADKRKARKALQPAMNDRQASSAAFSAAGMVKSAHALLPMLADETRAKLDILRDRLDKSEKSLSKAWDAYDDPSSRPFVRKEEVLAAAERLKGGSAGTRRRIVRLERRLADLEERVKAGRVSVCLGGKKLFREQFNLAENGLADHAEWRDKWETARSSNILMMGGRGETARNQICQASENPDGSFDLKITLPPALWETRGKHLVLMSLRFEEKRKRKKSKGISRDHGRRLLSRLLSAPGGKDAVPISWRLTRDARGWLCSFTADEGAIEARTSRLAGMVGVDVNADHLAVTAVDRHGNVLDAWNVPLVLTGLSADQAADVVGKAARDCARAAKRLGFALAMENLDFADKKTKSSALSKKHRTMLSAFATKKILTAIGRACRDEGVEAWSVNPAYTSVIGRYNHQGRTSMTSHQGAAAAIARRALGSRERPSRKAVDAWKRVQARRGSKEGRAPEDARLPAETGFWKGLSKARTGTKRAQTGKAARPDPAARPVRSRCQSATVRGGPGETQSPGNQDPFGDRG